MKYIYTFVFIFLCSLTFLNAQIPNAGFESWTNGEPDNWLTTNSSPDYIPFTQSNDAHEGVSAIQGTVVSLQGFSVPIALTSATGDNGGFTINFRPDALHGWYKFTSVGGDVLIITTAFGKNGSAIGGESFLTDVSKSSYSEFVLNTLWITGDVPDTAYIVFQITNTTSGFPHAGSSFIIDDLSWGTATDVSDEKQTPTEFSLAQNYPNPFNPSTKIRYSIPDVGSGLAQTVLKVYDILGNEVATLVNEEKPAGVYEVTFDASELSSGIYFYKISAGSFNETKKMILLR
ncbi:MAG TPA: T9SS type A sorting domain-containing protein [Ignavibacteriaceae bacterium]|nr:T9SS type A sorting domain-containing protein [Ignavibacteriaceae bacterium]